MGGRRTGGSYVSLLPNSETAAYNVYYWMAAMVQKRTYELRVTFSWNKLHVRSSVALFFERTSRVKNILELLRTIYSVQKRILGWVGGGVVYNLATTRIVYMEFYCASYITIYIYIYSAVLYNGTNFVNVKDNYRPSTPPRPRGAKGVRPCIFRRGEGRKKKMFTTDAEIKENLYCTKCTRVFRIV